MILRCLFIAELNSRKEIQTLSCRTSLGILNLTFGILNLEFAPIRNWNLFSNQFINHTFKDKAMKREHGVPIQLAPNAMRFEGGGLV